MNKSTKFFIALGIISAFFIGTYRAPLEAFAGAIYRDQFNAVTIDATDSIGTGGTIIVSSSSYTPGAAHFLSIVNSGSNGVSCFPITTNSGESTAGLTYGGGWWLAPSGGAISLDGAAIYGGTVWCETGTGTSVIGVVAR